MKIISHLFLGISFLGIWTLPSSTFAAGETPSSPGITISSPKNGAVVNGREKNELVFDARPSPNGNHFHFYVDKGNPDIVRVLKGTYTLPVLSPGGHEICIEEATADHVLTGLQKCITVTAR